MNSIIYYFLFIIFLHIPLAPSLLGSADDNEYVLKNRVKAFKNIVESKGVVETDILTGLAYKIRLKGNNKVLDSTSNMISLENSQDNENQVWTLIDAHKSNGYIIRIMRDNEKRVLDCGKSDGIDMLDFFHHWGLTSWDLHQVNHRHESRQVWRLGQTTGEEKQFFTLSTQNWKDQVLTFDESTNQISFKKIGNPVGETQLWELVPANYQLSSIIETFDYNFQNMKTILSNTENSYVAFKAINKGSVPDIHHVSITKTVTKSSSWSFSKSDERTFLSQLTLKATVQPIKIEKPAPIVQANSSTSTVGSSLSTPSSLCNIGGEISRTLTWGSKTTSIEASQKLEQNAIEFNFLSDITVPSHKQVIYKLVWQENMIEIPFNAKVVLSGSAKRLKKDGNIEFSELNSADLLHLLRYSSYKGNKFTEDAEGNISGQIKGQVRIINAQDGQVCKEEFPIQGNRKKKPQVL